MAEIFAQSGLKLEISEYGKSRIDLTYYYGDYYGASIIMRFKKPSSLAEAEELARLFVEYAQTDSSNRYGNNNPPLIYEF